MDTPEKNAFLLQETRTIRVEQAINHDSGQTHSGSDIESRTNSADNKLQTGDSFAQRYEILGLLGKGGSGEVYRVKHLHLDKEFALKILYTPKGLDQETMLRFQQEAKLGTKLDHEGIVRVHDFGVHEGMPYMIMDLLSGQPLSMLIKGKELNLDRTIKVFGLILNALAHAHEKSVVHRDIKPGNILISKDENGEDKVCIVDLGIAKILDQEKTKDMNLTKTGDVFGTPFYMSPEQCLGLKVDSRSDIYSLGCVIYEAVCGNPPFEGESVFEIINKHVNEAPPAFPSEIRKSKGGIQLEAVVLKALAKDKENRYQFALEMASELKQVQLGQAGLITGMRLHLKLMNGRRNALQKNAALWSYSAAILSLLAIFCSTALFCLPQQINSEYKEMKRNALILKELNRLIDMKDPTRIDDREMMKHRIARLKAYTVNDKRQKALLKDFAVEYVRAVSTSDQKLKEARLSFESMALEKLRSLFSELREITEIWTKASLIRAELYGITYQQYKLFSASLSQNLLIFSILPWLGVFIELMLFALLTFKLRMHFVTRQAYKTAVEQAESKN